MEISKIIGSRRAQDIVCCTPSTSVREALTMLASKRIGALPVIRDDQVVGIFSERDVIYRLAADGAGCLDHAVADVMTAPPITVDPATNVDQALDLMTRRRIRHLPVIEGGRMVGFISIGDLVKSRIDEVEHEAEAMRNYIQMT